MYMLHTRELVFKEHDVLHGLEQAHVKCGRPVEIYLFTYTHFTKLKTNKQLKSKLFHCTAAEYIERVICDRRSYTSIY